MSLEATESRVQYNGNGATTVFPYDFMIREDEDLRVTSLIVATGTTDTYTLGIHYSVSGEGTGSGNVTFATAPATGVRVTIERVVSRTQEVDYVENDSFPAETHEQALDKLTMIAQEHDQSLLRTLRQATSDVDDIATLPPKDQRASGYLYFDADGNPTSIAAEVDSVPVSAFMQTVLDDATPSDAAATLAVLPLTGGTLTGGLLTTSTIVSSRTAITGYTRISPNFCKPILPIIAVYTPAASCTGHVLDANLPTNTLVMIKVYWRVKSNNEAAARSASTTFSGSSDTCAVTLATSAFSCYEQAAVAAGTVIGQTTDVIYCTTSSGTLYSTDANAGGNGTAHIYQLEVLGYFD